MDKKLTDLEIVKALKEILELMCNEGDLQRSATISNALDLINRLQAEIEKLKTENRILSQKRFNIFERIEYSDKLKAEAYKEFAERLKEWFRKESEVYKLIDNLLKELVGE